MIFLIIIKIIYIVLIGYLIYINFRNYRLDQGRFFMWRKNKNKKNKIVKKNILKSVKFF